MASLLLLNLLCGCWDIKEIQDMNYISAIGIDYNEEDKKYVLYTQMLDFTSVAKTEAGKSGVPPQVWIGKIEGETLDMAMNNLYDSSQERTSWGHISSIVISEKLLKSEVVPKLDTLTRYQEIRITPWVFGTKESMEQLFSSPAFFNLSPLNTLTHEPLEVYKQKSYIVPIRYFDFMAKVTEPAFTVFLPSLSFDDTTWKKNDKADSKLVYNGVYVMSKGKLNGLLTEDKITGLRWLEKNTRRSPVPIHKNNDLGAVLILQRPKIKKELIISQGVPKYKIHVKLKGNAVEVRKEFTRSELEQEAAKVVTEQIWDTYKHGKDIKADLYSLEHLLFKKNTALWKKLKQSSEFLLNEESLDLVTVDVNLEHTGMKLLPRKE